MKQEASVSRPISPLMRVLAVLVAVGLLTFVIAACGGDDDSSADAGTTADAVDSGSGEELSGTVQIDGSSTVAPFAEAAAELFQQENPGVQVTVGTSGTGGGFEKFCAGETDISDASRPIKDEEAEICDSNGISHEQVTVANDALAVLVNPNNPVQCLSVDQLNQIWGPDSKLTKWSEVKGLDDAPNSDLDLYGPGTDSGTFDYFTEAINGEEGAMRTDYNNIGEDDNSGITGVTGSEGGMFFVGFSYYTENEGSVKALEIDGGSGCVAPSTETVQDASYSPLGRGLFMYASDTALAKPEVVAFFEFITENDAAISEAAGFIGLTDEQRSEAEAKVASLAG